MSSAQTGTLFVLTGPSGAGKGATMALVKERLDDIYLSVSATTRRPRPGEKNGTDYHFIDHDQFQELIESDRMLEYAEYVGNFYGTPKEPVWSRLERGIDVVLEIEVDGALKVRKRVPHSVMIFIVPSSFAELENRLRNRGSESEETIKKRMLKARIEYKSIDAYDYLVINDDLETAAGELCAIITACRCKVDKRKNRVY